MLNFLKPTTQWIFSLQWINLVHNVPYNYANRHLTLFSETLQVLFTRENCWRLYKLLTSWHSMKIKAYVVSAI